MRDYTHASPRVPAAARGSAMALVGLSLLCSHPRQGAPAERAKSDSVREGGVLTLGAGRREPRASSPMARRSQPDRVAHPNEPAGYIAFAENDGSFISEKQSIPGGRVLGAWANPRGPNRPMRVKPELASRDDSEEVDDEESEVPPPTLDVEGNRGLLTIAEDPAAPASPPYVVQTKFPRGFRAGRGPVDWWGWAAGAKGTKPMRSVYLSLWVRIVGPDYENQITGTKMGFWGAGHGAENAPHNSWLFLKGTGKQVPASAFHVELHQSFRGRQGPAFPNRNLGQNVDQRKLMTCGTWHHWEVVLQLNTPGRTDGIFKWWIDGRQVMDYRDVRYTYGEFTSGFWAWRWNPTWGGGKGVKTRDDLIQFDHVYMSGIPYESASASN